MSAMTQLRQFNAAVWSTLSTLPTYLNASVKPRQGLFANLIVLAGQQGEISYPTDYPNCRIFHNGVANEAVPCWAGGGYGSAQINRTNANDYTIPLPYSAVELIGTYGGSDITVILPPANKLFPPGHMIHVFNNGTDVVHLDGTTIMHLAIGEVGIMCFQGFGTGEWTAVGKFVSTYP